MGEVVVTRPKDIVLDIGLKVAPGKIRCRYSGHHTDGKWYGGDDETLKRFKPVGCSMSEEDWEKISCKKSTMEICDFLDIPYVWKDEDELTEGSSGCKYYEDGQCNRMSREDELSEEILKLNEEIKLLQSDNQSLKNMIVKICYEKYGE